MRKKSFKKTKLGFIWICRSCNKTVNPTWRTYFENCRIPFSNVMKMIAYFLDDVGVEKGHDLLERFRQEIGYTKKLSKSTYVNHMKALRNICFVVSANDFYKSLGGENKTIEIDETFLTKRKYQMGRQTDAMTITILGLHCREDKKTLFFRVPSKKKDDLYPFIERFTNNNTNVVCTDGGRQYVGVGSLFKEGTQHKVVYHNKLFVDKQDNSNHINGIENQNRWLKRDIKSRVSVEDIDCYIKKFIYFKNTFVKEKNKVQSLGEKLKLFLTDMSRVFPGILGEPLEWIDVDYLDEEEKVDQ
jgi:ISXO2 transposase-like protein